MSEPVVGGSRIGWAEKATDEIYERLKVGGDVIGLSPLKATIAEKMQNKFNPSSRIISPLFLAHI